MKHSSRWWTAAEVTGYLNVAGLAFACLGWVIGRALATSPRDFTGDERSVTGGTQLFWWALGFFLLVALTCGILANVRTYQRRSSGPALLAGLGLLLTVLSTPRMLPVLAGSGLSGSNAFAVVIWPGAVLTTLAGGLLLLVLRKADRVD